MKSFIYQSRLWSMYGLQMRKFLFIYVLSTLYMKKLHETWMKTSFQLIYVLSTLYEKILRFLNGDKLRADVKGSRWQTSFKRTRIQAWQIDSRISTRILNCYIFRRNGRYIVTFPVITTNDNDPILIFFNLKVNTSNNRTLTIRWLAELMTHHWVISHLDERLSWHVSVILNKHSHDDTVPLIGLPSIRTGDHWASHSVSYCIGSRGWRLHFNPST